MIINKIEELYTQEEKARLESIAATISEEHAHYLEGEHTHGEYSGIYDALKRQEEDIKEAARSRYLDGLTTEAAICHIKEILDNITRGDYIDYAISFNAVEDAANAKDKAQGIEENPDNYIHCVMFLCKNIKEQTDFIAKQGTEKPHTVYMMAAARALELYPQAAEEKEKFCKRLEREKGIDEIAAYQTATIKAFGYPVDKTNKIFYSIAPPMPSKDANGQLQFIPVEIGTDNKPAAVYYSYYVDREQLKALGISDKFTQKDFAICAIIETYREAGNGVITLSQLHKALGNKAKPSSAQITALKKSVDKLRLTTIEIDTREIAEAWSIDNYAIVRSYLLPVTICEKRATINGRLVETYIKILDEAPLLGLAKRIGQITTISADLLTVPVTHNEMFYNIFNYLVREIAYIKNPKHKRVNKILYSTIYEEIGISACGSNSHYSRDKAQADKIIAATLDHFINCGHIKGYKNEITKSTGDLGFKIFYNSGTIEEK